MLTQLYLNYDVLISGIWNEASDLNSPLFLRDFIVLRQTLELKLTTKAAHQRRLSEWEQKNELNLTEITRCNDILSFSISIITYSDIMSLVLFCLVSMWHCFQKKRKEWTFGSRSVQINVYVFQSAKRLWL